MKKMDVELIIIIAAGLLSLSTALVAKINGDKKEKQYLASQDELREKANIIAELQSRNHKTTEELLNLQKEINLIQKNLVSEVTGGNSIPEILVMNQPTDKEILISMINSGKHTLYDVSIQFTDPRLFEIAQSQLKPHSPENASYNKKILQSGMGRISIPLGNLNKGSLVTFYKLEVLPTINEFQLTFSISCRNGGFQQITKAIRAQDSKFKMKSEIFDINNKLIKTF